MSLIAYEDACLRAELFGQPKPDKEEFLAKNKHLDVVEFEEIDIKGAENTAMLDEDIKSASGGLAELNTILTSTQTKINRLRGVCGSLTNFFRVKITAKDNLSYSSEPSYVGQTNFDKDSVQPQTSNDVQSINHGLAPEDGEIPINVRETPSTSNVKETGDINSAINDLDAMQSTEATSLLSKATVKDMGQQITSQVSKLDNLICKADRAQSSLNHQNKQMRSFLR